MLDLKRKLILREDLGVHTSIFLESVERSLGAGSYTNRSTMFTVRSVFSVLLGTLLGFVGLLVTYLTIFKTDSWNSDWEFYVNLVVGLSMSLTGFGFVATPVAESKTSSLLCIIVVLLFVPSLTLVMNFVTMISTNGLSYKVGLFETLFILLCGGLIFTQITALFLKRYDLNRTMS